jgi:hypothetical protein
MYWNPTDALYPASSWYKALDVGDWDQIHEKSTISYSIVTVMEIPKSNFSRAQLVGDWNFFSSFLYEMVIQKSMPLAIGILI